MVKFKCPECGNVSKTLTGFREITEWDEYTVDKNRTLKHVSEESTNIEDVRFECLECNEIFGDYLDFEIVA